MSSLLLWPEFLCTNISLNSVAVKPFIHLKIHVACEQAPSEVGRKNLASKSERRDSASEASGTSVHSLLTRPLSARSARPRL